MKIHVMRTVSSCFAALRLWYSIQRSISQFFHLLPACYSVVVIMGALLFGTCISASSQPTVSAHNIAARLVYKGRATVFLHYFATSDGSVSHNALGLYTSCGRFCVPLPQQDRACIPGKWLTMDDWGRLLTRWRSASSHKLIVCQSRLTGWWSRVWHCCTSSVEWVARQCHRRTIFASFTARTMLSAVLQLRQFCPSVCLSVRTTHAGIVWKRMNTGWFCLTDR